MRRFIFCLVFGLYLDLGCLQGKSSEQDKVCDDGNFCQYVCQCNKACQADFKCSDNDKCKPGWFGYRCQYQDLAVFNAILTTVPSSRNVDWLTDQNDTTCNTQIDLKSITVTWPVLTAIPLTWTRMTVNDPQSLSIFEMQFIKEGTTEKSSCLNETLAEVNNKTLDRRCNDDVRITSLTLSGNLSSLCSFYISGGRNIAYKQKAEQSSFYPGLESYGADLVVDGNRNNNFNAKTCTHTHVEMSPSWNLTLQSNYVIKRFILYNRGSNSDRLNGFFITTYDEKQSKIGSYKDKTTSAYELTYYANLNGSVNTAVNFISISLRGGEKILTLCEVEAYGECPAGKWSLPCSKRCMDSCPDTCDRDTGLCNVVCIGYSNPPQCNTACSSGKWGINCRLTCSDRCEGTCHAKTGLCYKGCKGYSDPPNCETACSPIKWGTNCSLNCSEHCQNSTCNSLNGNCEHGCKPGYQLADCKQDCPKGQWGQNCTSACNENCYDGMCNNVNGSCVFGCIDGFQLPNCTLKCFKGAYGRNCSSNCLSTCDNGECDPVKGACGLKKFIMEMNSFGIGFAVCCGIVALVILALNLSKTVLVQWRPRSKFISVYDETNIQEEKCHRYEQITKAVQPNEEVNDGYETSVVTMSQLKDNSHDLTDSPSEYEYINVR